MVEHLQIRVVSPYKVGENFWKGSGGPIFKEGIANQRSGLVRTDYYYLFVSIKYPTLKKNFYFKRRISSDLGLLVKKHKNV
jgi:hypothetical protein